MSEPLAYIKACIKTIPDYPKDGILFRDVTSLLENPAAFHQSVQLLAQPFKDKGYTKVVGTEARGFLFGAPVALALGLGFVPVRKPGKLPRATIAQNYQLEYGEDTLEIHKDALSNGDKVLLIDDLLATGGTIEATTKLVRALGAEVGEAAFVVALPDLGGIERLQAIGVKSHFLCEF